MPEYNPVATENVSTDTRNLVLYFCPVCGESTWHLEGRHGGYQWRDCEVCGRYFNLSDEELEARKLYCIANPDTYEY
jgi:hypothetical protein